MKRKAVIILNFEVEDFVEAKAREGEIKRFVDGLRPEFSDIHLQLMERRPRTAKRAPTPPVYMPAPVAV